MPFKRKTAPKTDSKLQALYLNAMGAHKLLQGRLRSALRDFKKADRLEPNSTELLYSRALAYFIVESFTTSISLLEKAIAIEPNEARLFHLKGLAESAYPKSYPLLSCAIKSLKKAIELGLEASWDLANAFTKLGRLTGETIELARAVQLFEESESLHAYNARFYLDFFAARYALSERLGQEPSMCQALEHLKQAKSLEKSLDLDIQFAAIYKRLFEISGKMTYFNLANTAFSKALKKPNAAYLHLWGDLLKRATLVRRDPLFLKLGMKKFEGALILEPANLNYALSYVVAIAYHALITESIDEIPKAAQYLSLLDANIESDPKLKAELFYAKGLIKTALGFFHSSASFFQEAMPLFSHATQASPSSAIYWHAAGISALGLSYIEGHEKQIEKALLNFKKAKELDSDLDYAIDAAFASFRMAQIEGSLFALDTSIALFEKTLAKSPERRMDWLFHYGCALRLRGEVRCDPTLLEEALGVLREVEKDPSFALPTHFEMGLAHGMIGELRESLLDLKRALFYFESVMRSDIENEKAFCEAAVAGINLAHLLDGPNTPHYQESEKWLVHAARLGSLPALYYLGCLYALSGMPERAFAYLERAKNYGALPPPSEINDDPWLDNIKESAEFKRLLEEL